MLINKPGIGDEKTLRAYEYSTVAAARVALMQNPPKGNFDLKHLQTIHARLFKDVYPWAGKIRTVDIAKGDTYFAANGMIQSAGNKLFAGLAKENHLRGLDKDGFADRAAYYMGEINALHPFREGNGRTQRTFMTLLAREAGYELSWRGVSQDQMVKASVASFDGHNQGLREIIRGGLADIGSKHSHESGLKQSPQLNVDRDKEYGF